MNDWQTSRSTDRRHTHTLVRNSQGQDICTGCWQQVIKPIQSSDDPRLEQSGFMRSPHHEEDRPKLSMLLPDFLVYAYNETQGDFPYAPYIMIIMLEHDRRGDLSETLWESLAQKSR